MRAYNRSGLENRVTAGRVAFDTDIIAKHGSRIRIGLGARSIACIYARLIACIAARIIAETDVRIIALMPES